MSWCVYDIFSPCENCGECQNRIDPNFNTDYILGADDFIDDDYDEYDDGFEPIELGGDF